MDAVAETRIKAEKQHFQDGLFIWDILTFNEEAVREAILNAVSHSGTLVFRFKKG